MNKPVKYLPTKISLTLRIVVAAYLIYLGYGLLTADGAKTWYAWVFGIGFCVIGLAFCVLSGKSLLMGQYQGGAADPEMNEEDTDSTTEGSSSNETAELEEITDAEVIEGTVTDARIMGMYENSKIETALDKDIEELD